MEVSIENVSKSYGFQKAVDNISFKVNTGEIVGFLGPNGKNDHHEDHHLFHAPG
jgi:ABC-2 type transport system ATP-binding protein